MNDQNRDVTSGIPGGGRSAADQRYLPRWNVKNRVKYALCDRDGINEGTTQDLSCAGACLKSEELLMPGQELRMKIFLDEENAVEVLGHVVWNRLSSDGRYAGVHFDTASPECQDTILNYAFEINPDTMVKHWFSGWNNQAA